LGPAQNSSPLLRGYHEDGSRYGADIDLFKDSPDIQKAVVNECAAGPAGTTAIAADLIYGPRQVNHAILIYVSAGRPALGHQSATVFGRSYYS
jgi:hypothetical protein